MVAREITTRIVSVAVVEGKILAEHWRNPMQKVITEDHDFYIDAMPTDGGFAWYEHVGKIVKASVRESVGYQWLDKPK